MPAQRRTIFWWGMGISERGMCPDIIWISPQNISKASAISSTNHQQSLTNLQKSSEKQQIICKSAKGGARPGIRLPPQISRPPLWGFADEVLFFGWFLKICWRLFTIFWGYWRCFWDILGIYPDYIRDTSPSLLSPSPIKILFCFVVECETPFWKFDYSEK